MKPDTSDLTLPERDRQELIRWTAACAERLLPVFVADRPEDSRPKKALAGTELARELEWQRAHVPERFREYVYPEADG